MYVLFPGPDDVVLAIDLLRDTQFISCFLESRKVVAVYVDGEGVCRHELDINEMDRGCSLVTASGWVSLRTIALQIACFYSMRASSSADQVADYGCSPQLSSFHNRSMANISRIVGLRSSSPRKESRAAFIDRRWRVNDANRFVNTIGGAHVSLAGFALFLVFSGIADSIVNVRVKNADDVLTN